MAEIRYVNCDGCGKGLVAAERIVGSVLICHCERCFQQLQTELDTVMNTLRWIKAELRTDNSEGNKMNRVKQALKG